MLLVFHKFEIQEQKVVDFDNIDKFGDDFKNLDVGFCALGTTRAKSGNVKFCLSDKSFFQAEYYKIDHDYVVNSAKIAKEQGDPFNFTKIELFSGVKEFVLVTAAGANENSFFFYTKTKGEIERDVAALGFDKTLFLRPGFIDERNAGFYIGILENDSAQTFDLMNASLLLFSSL